MKTKKSFIVIGADHHARQCHINPGRHVGMSLAGVYDMHEERLREFDNGSTLLATSIDELLELCLLGNDAADAIVIASAPYERGRDLEYVVNFLREHDLTVPVQLDQPLAGLKVDLDHLGVTLELAREARIPVVACQPRAFDPAYHQLFDDARTGGIIQQLGLYEIAMRFNYPAYVKDWSELDLIQTRWSYDFYVLRQLFPNTEIHANLENVDSTRSRYEVRGGIGRDENFLLFSCAGHLWRPRPQQGGGFFQETVHIDSLKHHSYHLDASLGRLQIDNGEEVVMNNVPRTHYSQCLREMMDSLPFTTFGHESQPSSELLLTAHSLFEFDTNREFLYKPTGG